MPAKLFLFAERFRPRKGHWAFYGNARYAAEGLGGIDEGATTLYFEPTYHVNDTLSFIAGLEARHNPDWLLWRPDEDPATRDNRLGTFRSDMLFLNAGMTWLVDSKQELRMRLEAIGLDARTAPGLPRSPDGDAGGSRRGRSRLRAEQPGLPGALPLRTCAAVVPVRGLRARWLAVRRGHRRRCSGRRTSSSMRSTCATASSCW